MSKPITDTLSKLQGGVFMSVCSDQLAELVKSVDETGKPGKLTITLDLKKSSGAIAILAKCTNKSPERAPDSDLLWPTVEGNLVTQNPAQRDLELRVVDEPKAPVREIDQSTGEIRQVNA